MPAPMLVCSPTCGVADVGEVADLHAFVEDGVLDFDEVADMDILGQFRAGTEAGEGADGGAAADVAAFKVAKALDLRAGFDGDAGAEEDVRADDGIAADVGVEREEHGFGRGQGDAVVQRLGAGAGLEGGFGGGQFGAGVDAQRLGLFADHDTGGEAAVAARVRRCRSGSIRPRRCRCFDLGDEGEEQLRVGADDAGIAERQGAHQFGRVLPFGDFQKLGAVGDEPAVAPGVGCVEAEDDDGVRWRASSMARSVSSRMKGVSA